MAIANWTGEVSIMQAGKSYYLPPTFVAFPASSYVVAVAKAVRIAKQRMKVTRGPLRVETVLVKVTRCKAVELKEVDNG